MWGDRESTKLLEQVGAGRNSWEEEVVQCRNKYDMGRDTDKNLDGIQGPLEAEQLVQILDVEVEAFEVPLEVQILDVEVDTLEVPRCCFAHLQRMSWSQGEESFQDNKFSLFSLRIFHQIQALCSFFRSGDGLE